MLSCMSFLFAEYALIWSLQFLRQEFMGEDLHRLELEQMKLAPNTAEDVFADV